MEDLSELAHGVEKIESSGSMYSIEDKEEFISQYKDILAETRGKEQIVYVFYARDPMPRLKGESKILYIGRAKYDLWSRYYVAEDTEEFWDVYRRVIENFGPIKIDVYQTSEYQNLEKEALRYYWNEHLELPPMNRSG